MIPHPFGRHRFGPFRSRTIAAAIFLSAIATTMGMGTGVGLARLGAQSANAGADATERLIAALALHEGSVVAEIGAGNGARTVAIARHVGSTGRVYSSELGDDHLRTLRKAVGDGKAQNVTVLEAKAAETNLPDGCCDALYMEFVYHHFEDPAAMNASIWRSLKPGGRVAVVDFPPDDGAAEAARPQDRDENPHHGVMAATVKAELERAGFEPVTVDESRNHAFLVVMRKPA